MKQKSLSTRSNPFSEQLRFLRGAFANPRGVGAVAPSSPDLGDAIAAQIDPAQSGPVLELGPGSGAVTRAILRRGIAPERLTVIEWDAAFADLIKAQCPGVNVIQGDAFTLDRTLDKSPAGPIVEPFCAVVSCLPLLNFPQDQRQALIEAAFARMAPGAPLIQFSYGLLGKPIAPPAGVSASLAALVWKNLPPARVWVYRRAEGLQAA